MTSERTARQIFFWALCAAVLFVQSLGVVHTVSHGPAKFGQVSHSLVRQAPSSHHQAPGIQSPGLGMLAALFGGHNDIAKCLSLDHLAASAPVSAEPRVAPPALLDERIACQAISQRTAPAFNGYLSRAPPLFV